MIKRSFFPGKENLAKPQAAGTPTRICPARIPPVSFTEFQNITKNSGESRRSSTYERRVGYLGSIFQEANPSPPVRIGWSSSFNSPAPIREPAARKNTGNAASSAKQTQIKVPVFFIFRLTPFPMLFEEIKSKPGSQLLLPLQQQTFYQVINLYTSY